MQDTGSRIEPARPAAGWAATARAGARRLWMATPVRLALLLVALFTLVSLATATVAYFQLRSSLTSQIAANLNQQIAGFQVARDPATMAALVRAEARAADPDMRIVAFLLPDGSSVGNAEAGFDGQTLTIRPRTDGPPRTAADYVLLAVPSAGGLLVVGESRAPLSALKATFLRLVGYSLAPTALLSLAAAIWLSRSLASRVAHIERTLDRLTEGDLAARVGAAEGSDDLARIGAGIDRMAQAQQAATSALRQVSADIAHDLKTPVQRIAVLLSDLRGRLAEGGAEADLADRAHVEAERAVAIFQSLLQIAQVEAGAARHRFARVDLAGLLATFAEIYEPAAEEDGHVLRLAPLPPGPVEVSGDETLLGQAIANLIENALRHTPPQSRVDLALTAEDDHAVVTVADNGPGIPEAERDKVVARMYRLERSRTTPGNGLGLALVAAIAELHAGRLELADNHPGLAARLRIP
ncbi:HAMP domain-containing sensor histidine kinase, partial [Albidovulum sp.]